MFRVKINDILGITTVNTSYGSTNALINTLNWISSSFWDGRYGIVVEVGDGSYGSGAIAVLIGPNGKITFSKERSTFSNF